MDVFSLLVGGIIGFVSGIIITGRSFNIANALKLSNVMNTSMLECVTK